MKSINAHLLVTLSVFLVAGSFIASNALMDKMNEFSLNLARFVIATLCLAPTILLNKKYRQQIPKTLKCAFVTSFFYSFYFVFLLIALRYTHVLNTSSLYTLTPLLTAVLSVFILKGVIDKKLIFVYLLAIVGTLIVIFNGDFQALLSLSFNKGDGIYMLGVLAMGSYTVSLKKLAPKVDTIVLTFTSLAFGVFWMGIVLVISQQSIDWHLLETTDYISVIYLAIPATLITSYLFQTANITLTPSQISAYGYLCPAFVALINYQLYAETISTMAFIGIGISSLATWFILNKKSDLI